MLGPLRGPDYHSQIATACWRYANAGGPVGLVIMTLSTLHFEVTDEDRLRRVGISKEHRVDTQVAVGLLVTASGFPLEIALLEGNKAEKKTLVPVIEQIKARHAIRPVPAHEGRHPTWPHARERPSFGPDPAGYASPYPQDDPREQPSAWIGQCNTPNQADHEGAQGGWSTWIRHCCPVWKRVAPPPHTLNRWRYEWIASWITHFLKPPTIRLPAPSATSASSIACGQWAECLQKPMAQTLSS